MTTYGQIRQDVWWHSGFDSKTCWIAHVKELNGLPVRGASNRRGPERQVPCPDDKRPAIEGAMRRLGILP